MGFIFRILLILAVVGFLAAVAAAILAVIWLSKKLLEKKSAK
jgi:hypothetical protein